MIITEKIKKGFKYVTDPDYRFFENASFGMYNRWSDEKYLKAMFHSLMGYELDLENPKTFNEKMQWIKLYDRNPEYTVLVDKYAVRSYVAEKIGSEYLIPLLGVWKNASDIDFSSLPGQFVLKCNHNSGRGIVICRDKSSFDVKAARRQIRKALANDYYLLNREWPYKDVPRKVVCEKYMIDQKDGELKDYKFYVFGGVVRAVLVISGRGGGKKNAGANFYDESFNRLYFTWGYPPIEGDIRKPASFDMMKEMAVRLAEGLTEARVDFYEVDGHPYFGEITLFDGAGFEKFEPQEWDRTFGNWIKLPFESKETVKTEIHESNT